MERDRNSPHKPAQVGPQSLRCCWRPRTLTRVCVCRDRPHRCPALAHLHVESIGHVGLATQVRAAPRCKGNMQACQRGSPACTQVHCSVHTGHTQCAGVSDRCAEDTGGCPEPGQTGALRSPSLGCPLSHPWLWGQVAPCTAGRRGLGVRGRTDCLPPLPRCTSRTPRWREGWPWAPLPR